MLSKSHCRRWAKRPSFAARIQLNRCCELMSCRRAISATGTPALSASATIRPFSSAVHRRRRPTPVRISTRPNESFVSHIVSVICAKPSHQISEKPATSRARASRWAQRTAYRQPARTVEDRYDARRRRSPRPSRHHLRDECRELSTSRRTRSQARSRSPARPRDNQGKALTTLSVNQTQRDGVQRQSNSGGEKTCKAADQRQS